MFQDRLEGDRFFARIRQLDLECPRCAEVVFCGGKGGAYNRRLGQFTCPSCGLVLTLGVIAYPATSARHKQAPPDWQPNYRQSLALRAQMPAVVAQQAKGWTDPHNVVIREGCKCQLSRRGLIVHPGCPIHGGEIAK